MWKWLHTHTGLIHGTCPSIPKSLISRSHQMGLEGLSNEPTSVFPWPSIVRGSLSWSSQPHHKPCLFLCWLPSKVGFQTYRLDIFHCRLDILHWSKSFFGKSEFSLIDISQHTTVYKAFIHQSIWYCSRLWVAHPCQHLSSLDSVESQTL